VSKQARKHMISTALERCAAEAIHRPGTVQPHGYFLAVDTELVIQHVSENLCSRLDIDTSDLLGKSLGLVQA